MPERRYLQTRRDGIVLIDQDNRGWRLCISGCPYKKIYFNWKSGKSEKCISVIRELSPAKPTVCSETCVGRIGTSRRYCFTTPTASRKGRAPRREVDLYRVGSLTAAACHGLQLPL
ncbi:4Fe-4S dicluster domain-containing protein [Shigella flexneri]